MIILRRGVVTSHREPGDGFQVDSMGEHKSRRHFMKFWLEYCPATAIFWRMGWTSLHILVEPIKDVQALHFVELLADNRSLAVASWTTLETIITVTEKVQDSPDSRLRDLHATSRHNENLSYPEQPFCCTRLLWQCSSPRASSLLS